MDNPRNRYDMPADFGPSHVPLVSEVEAAQVTMIKYRTTRDAARRIVPARFEIPDEPSVSITHISYENVGYLGGRGYTEIVCGISAVFEGAQRIAASYVPVLWVDQIGALLTGREYQGFPKLLGEIERDGEGGLTRGFGCSEYGTRLLTASLSDLRPLDAAKLQRVQAASAEVVSLSWKHIPSLTDTPDADYPVRSVMRWDYEAIWTGQGKVEFLPADFAAAPYGHRAIAAFQRLPVLEYQSSLVGVGSAVIDRSKMIRLE